MYKAIEEPNTDHYFTGLAHAHTLISVRSNHAVLLGDANLKFDLLSNVKSFVIQHARLLINNNCVEEVMDCDVKTKGYFLNKHVDFQDLKLSSLFGFCKAMEKEKIALKGCSIVIELQIKTDVDLSVCGEYELIVPYLLDRQIGEQVEMLKFEKYKRFQLDVHNTKNRMSEILAINSKPLRIYSPVKPAREEHVQISINNCTFDFKSGNEVTPFYADDSITQIIRFENVKDDQVKGLIVSEAWLELKC